MKSKHSSPERRKSSRSTRSRSIRSKSIRSRTLRSLKEKKSRRLSLQKEKKSRTLSLRNKKSKSPVEEWKKPYTYEKVKRGVDTDITYCIPVTKSRELGIGSINVPVPHDPCLTLTGIDNFLHF